MRHFLRLYELMQEWSQYDVDPMKCSNWTRKSELETEIKKEFKELTFTKLVKALTKLAKFIKEKRRRPHEKN